ncbi:MAG: hypothetical protein B6U97_04215 [Candidatus Altiarchaeales archaeon ex4484_96]|nr:MAG: hypothetical protein B6U97_04215 [Candidatus Altiarchaeales archaeon ex4484_96]
MHWREKILVKMLKKKGKIKTNDIVDNVNMCKVTTLKYLSNLYEKKIIDYDKIGPTKLWYIKSKSNSKDLDNHILCLLRDFENKTGLKPSVIITPDGVTLDLSGGVLY